MKVRCFSSIAGKKFEMYSLYRPTPLNLKYLLQFGTEAPASRSFAFLKTELPVRFANIMQEIKLLPAKLRETESFIQLSKMYNRSFETLLKYEDNVAAGPSVISDFTEDLSDILNLHSNVVATVASGIKQMQSVHNVSFLEENQLQYFLDRFYISRIGLRMLINQHTLLYGPVLCQSRSYVGAIDPECSATEHAISAYAHARKLCIAIYGHAPGCDIYVHDHLLSADKQSKSMDVWVDSSGVPSDSNYLFEHKPCCADLHVTGPDFSFCYIPEHLFHVLFELTKNAMRAVIEHCSDLEKLPRFNVVICNANEDVTIKLSDYGGGMPYHLFDQAFKYTFTTASHLSPEVDTLPPPSATDPCDYTGEAKMSPLAGRGHGLPLSRLYARYLGGDLRFTTVEGYGSSAFIYLKRCPETANELLPIFNQTSRSAYTSRDLPADWVSGQSLRNLRTTSVTQLDNNST